MKVQAKNQGLSQSAEAFTDDIQQLQQISSSGNTLSSWKCAIIRNSWYPLPVSRSNYWFGGVGLIELTLITLLFVVSLSIALLTDAKSAGGLANFLGGFGVLCAIRSGSVFFSFEKSLLWHKVFTSLMVITGIIHGVREDAIATGVLLITLLACTSAVYLLAAVNFNLFYHFHFWLFFIIAGAAMAHGAVFLFVSFLCWLVDLFLRYCVYQKEPETKATILPNTDILHITFSKKDFRNYECGQYCFLRFRTVSLEHHPFTIASSPLEDKVTFYMRNGGDWSQKVFQAIRRRSESEKTEALSVTTEGPYGQLNVDVLNPTVHEVVVLVGGGIGVTPLLSIWRHYQILARNHPNNPDVLPKKVYFIWSVRTMEEAKALYVSSMQEFLGKGDTNSDTKFTLTDNTMKFPKHNIVKDAMSSLTNFFSAPRHKAQRMTQTSKANYNPLHPETENDVEGAVGVADESSRFEYHFHVSSVGEAATFRSKKADMPNAALWRAERPDLSALFTSIGEYTKTNGGSKRVGVVTCGPMPMVVEVRDICNQSLRSCGSDTVRFDCHEDSFQLW